MSGPVLAAEPVELQAISLTNHLDHDWSSELLVVPLSAESRASLKRGVFLLSPDGKPVPHQIVPSEGGDQLAFQADLPADRTLVYRLMAGKDPVKTAGSLRIEDKDDRIRMWNGTAGIEIRKQLTDGKGPIAAVRLRSGAWAGDSEFAARRKLLSCDTRVTAKGPVFGEVSMEARFEGEARWTMRVRVMEGDPVVLFDETFNLKDDSTWRLQITPGFNPDHGLFRTAWYRPSEAPTHTLFVRPLLDPQNQPPFVLIPWINWSDGRQVACVNFFRKAPGVSYVHDPQAGGLLKQAETSRTDVLFFAAGAAGIWAEPGQSGPETGVPLRVQPDGAAAFEFPLRQPARHWVVGASTLDRTVVPDADLNESERFTIKYCGTSLQEVRNMILNWGDPRKAASLYPRIALTKEYLEKNPLRAGSKPPTADIVSSRLFTEHAASANLRRHNAPVWTHVACRLEFVLAADELLGRGVLDEAEFVRLRARLAFLAYKYASPDYYSVERGWAANPNMTTTRHAVVGLLGCLLADHPEAGTWNKLGASEIVRQLDEWVDPKGGWLESPHYQTLIGDGILLLIAAHRNGLSEDLFHPNLLKTIVYLSKIMTPPDPRFFGRRHFPDAGNTYRFETSVLPAVMAKFYRAKDPATADALQWLWIEQGKPMWPCIGGGSYLGYVARFFVDDFTPSGPPPWGSEVFPNSGTILRAHFPGPRESQLYLLHGPFNQHYDDDRGSFALWGKGQPLCLDWGYTMPYGSEVHNMLDCGQGVGKVAAFRTTPTLDYLHVDVGPWQRQVLFSKDKTPDGPAFFLVCDTSSNPGQWRQWFYTPRPMAIDGDVVRMTGAGDVDLDVWLAAGRAREFPILTPQEAAAVQLAPPVEGKPVERLNPEGRLLKANVTTLSCPQGIENGSNEYKPMTQHGLSLPVGPEQPVLALYYPRLRTETAPRFANLAEGRGVRVTSAAGEDYLFLSPVPFEFEEGPVRFSGVAGSIRIRGGRVELNLGAKGRIGYGDQILNDEGKTEEAAKGNG